MSIETVLEKVKKTLEGLKETNLYTAEEFFEVGLTCESKHPIELDNSLILPAGSIGVINSVDEVHIYVAFKLSDKSFQNFSINKEYVVSFKYTDFINDFTTHYTRD